ncbi:MAG: hypothetical protein HC824_15535 [Synechococcales cyanobacterium RM1_1_8]|nr:hypothetical protein [Synechococcales cyanobacterium RM1_1_8]
MNANSVMSAGLSPFIPQLPSGIATLALGTGQGGDLYLKAQDLTLRDGAKIFALVLVDRDLFVQLYASTNPALTALIGLPDAGNGQGGNVMIQADRLSVDGFNDLAPSSISLLSTLTFGSGNAGNLDITSRELNLSNGGVVASSSLFSISDFGPPVANSGLGNGGNLTVKAEQITVTGGKSRDGVAHPLGNPNRSPGQCWGYHPGDRGG